LELGAEVVGISNQIPTVPSMFESLYLKDKITHYQENIQNLEKIKSILEDEKPDFVFHLAAQAIVSESYSNPVETIMSNVVGTTSILEALRLLNFPCVAVIITSDKAYENIEQVWGYKENEKMGGKDVYSGSKGAAELIIGSYLHSFFQGEANNISLGIARAGNVIGGGDWAKDRIVVDCMKAWNAGNCVEIRSPEATRPWQHVLEPLSGYLSLGQNLLRKKTLHGEAFNFGPRSEQNKTVRELIKDLSQYWNFEKTKTAFKITDNIPFHEAGLLKLNCDKALSVLRWEATLNYQETIRFTSEWYYSFYKLEDNPVKITSSQIRNYQDIAKLKDLLWTR
jgi:CDP-glucose 4,6-dehydratase